jgi:serine/threonine protein kinase
VCNPAANSGDAAHSQDNDHPRSPDRGPIPVDFGLDRNEAVSGGCALALISGTSAYMAPEWVAGAAHRIDGRTGIYSLGVVLYELLCGRLAFPSSNAGELLRQGRDDEPQPPRQLHGHTTRWRHLFND